MKSLSEKLADLKVKFTDAKTDEEKSAILAEIDDVMADADKVLASLKTANNEAKTYREDKEELEKSLNAIEDKKKADEKPEDKEELEKIPEWAKKLSEKQDAIDAQLKAGTEKEKATAWKGSILAKMKEKELPEEFYGSINVDGETPEDIEKAVSDFKQVLVDKQLLSTDHVIMADKGNMQNEAIANYAKVKNQDGSAKGSIVGKKLTP